MILSAAGLSMGFVRRGPEFIGQAGSLHPKPLLCAEDHSKDGKMVRSKKTKSHQEALAELGF